MRNTLEKFHKIIKSIISIEEIEKDDLILFKSEVILIDGSTLRISEVYIENNLEKYSYYWFDEENNLLIGWDNAKHHKNISSFPHHKHVKDKKNIKESEERNLENVLNNISNIIHE